MNKKNTALVLKIVSIVIIPIYLLLVSFIIDVKPDLVINANGYDIQVSHGGRPDDVYVWRYIITNGNQQGENFFVKDNYIIKTNDRYFRVVNTGEIYQYNQLRELSEIGNPKLIFVKSFMIIITIALMGICSILLNIVFSGEKTLVEMKEKLVILGILGLTTTIAFLVDSLGIGWIGIVIVSCITAISILYQKKLNSHRFDVNTQNK